jgi:hypothetical protein
MPISIADGFDSEVLPMPYHMAPIADAALGDRRCAIESFGLAAQLAPMGTECFQAGRQPGARRELVPGRSRRAGLERVAVAELQRIDAELLRQHVHQRLVHDRRLWHAEAAEGAGGRIIGVDRACRAERRLHLIRAHGVHGHAVGDGRPPRGVGAGVEIAVEAHAGETAVGVRAKGRGHAGGMALGGGGH